MEEDARTYHELNRELDRFCIGKERIFIYGAGRYARLFYRFLHWKGVEISGFLVTNGDPEEYAGKPVVRIAEVMDRLDHASGIILAMKEEYKKEVRSRYQDRFLEKGIELLDVDENLLASLDVGKIDDKWDEWCEQFSCMHDMNPGDWKNILVIQLEAVIGDYIWGTAFLRELRSNFPREHISYVIDRKMENVFQNCPYIDELILYEYNMGKYTEALEEKVKDFAGKYLMSQEYDVAFLVKAVPWKEEEGLDNVLLAFYSRARVRIAHGFYTLLRESVLTDFWRKLFPVMAVNDKAEHDVSKDLSLLRVCNLNVLDERMELWTSHEEKKWAKHFLEKSIRAEDQVVIALGVAAREARRSWPAENYAELIRRLEARNRKLCFVVFGGDNAVKAGEVIEKNDAAILNIAGKTTLTESIAVMEQCDIYVGSDTSLLHMAAAFRHPVIELTANLKDGYETDMGHPVRTGPWKVPGRVIYPKKQLDGCTRICVKAYAHCISQIEVEEVAEAVLEMVERYCQKNKANMK